MDKKNLRSVLEGLTAGQEINVSFRTPKNNLSGAFKVLSSKKGRGRGGSRLATIQSLRDNATITIGTPDNEDLLNITANSVMVGAATEALDDTRSYPKSESKAVELKTAMRSLVGEAGFGRQVKMSSTIEAQFNGIFTVNSAKLERGRYGQIHLFLTGATGNQIEVWSYRHSTAIESFDIIALPSQ